MDVPIVDKIKDLISADDWEGVGKLIATKLNKALKKIPWSKIQKTAADIATKLARLLNGFFSVMDLADTLGNTVAQALNTGLIFAYNFLTTFDFVQFLASNHVFVTNMCCVNISISNSLIKSIIRFL